MSTGASSGSDPDSWHDQAMSTSSTPASTPSAVWAERTGTRQYIGRNSAGAEVRIGMGPGEFSPGELMKIALATCNTLSADHRLAKALGEDFEATVGCSTVKNDAGQRELLNQRVASAVDRHCTVGHTIEHGAPYTTTIVDPNED